MASTMSSPVTSQPLESNGALANILDELKAIRRENGESKKEIIKLREDISALRQDNEQLREDVSALRQDNEQLREDVSALRQDNEQLRAAQANIGATLELESTKMSANIARLVTISDSKYTGSSQLAKGHPIPPPSPSAPLQKAWYLRVWDWLTGLELFGPEMRQMWLKCLATIAAIGICLKGGVLIRSQDVIGFLQAIGLV
ncbi:hypothetical protein BKA62DRAFT_721936 [Auriculariales sp. MPI-PUGE-AT-0066]|nr:hypothetical protein BKA62DRAFT_721936 [Auriculariales sp. MPI-PUGE-AT-0066]